MAEKPDIKQQADQHARDLAIESERRKRDAGDQVDPEKRTELLRESVDLRQRARKMQEQGTGKDPFEP